MLAPARALAFTLAALAACASPDKGEPPDTAPADTGTPDTDSGADSDSDTDTDTGGDTDTADSADDTACLPTTWWPDGDGDGYGSTAGAVEACEAPAGTVATTGDCDDAQPETFPGGTEVCGNDVDEDCDRLLLACALEGDLALDFAGDAVEDIRSYEVGDVSPLGDVDGDGLDDFGILGEDSGGGGDYLAVFARLSGVVEPGDAHARWDTTDDLLLYEAVLRPAGDVLGTGAPAIAVGTSRELLLWETPVAAGAMSAHTYVLSDDMTGDWAPLAADVVSPGDVDGDGYDDLVASTRDEEDFDDGQEYTWIFRGPIDGDRLTSEADTFITEPNPGGRRIDRELSALGDQDGDGLADFAIASHDVALYVHSGDATGLVRREADAIGTIELDVYSRVPGAADFDGDGYADIALTTYPTASSPYDGAGEGRIFRGPLVGDLDATDAWATWLGDMDDQGLGTRGAALGDTDGDGGDDLLLSSSTDCGDPAVYLFVNVAAGTFGPTDARLTLRGHDDRYVYWLASAGDHDGDGLADFLVGGRSRSAGDIWLGLFYGE